MSNINFNTDKKSLTEGDIIELQWSCPAAERVDLTIDNGFRKSQVPLNASGTKKFRLNRSQGKTRLTITSWKEGKDTSKTIRVRVKSIPTLKAEAVDDEGRKVGAVKEWWNRMLTKWQSSDSRLKQAWQVMPEKKRLASTVMFILVGIAIVSAFAPRFMPTGMLLLMLYLAWVMLKR